MGTQPDDFPTEWAIPEFTEERNSRDKDSDNDVSLAPADPQRTDDGPAPEAWLGNSP
jgi:hypothetical protein